jgi:hypothetical protein
MIMIPSHKKTLPNTIIILLFIAKVKVKIMVYVYSLDIHVGSGESLDCYLLHILVGQTGKCPHIDEGTLSI